MNAGVGGWSPWQQARFLEREGWTFEPDVLVVAFVLNDVTEKLSLVRFGGEGEGWQLLRTARGRVDRWLSGSAVASWLRDAHAVLRFGADVRRGALRVEAADVKRLAADPAAPAFARAWRITLANLASLFDAARAREVPALLVVFPYRFQLDAPGRSAGPQRRLRDFAEERGIPFLDLLPAFVASPQGADALFLDASHPSAEGHRLASREIARRVRERGWLARSGG